MLNCRAQMLDCFHKIKLLLQFILYAIFQRFPAAQKPTLEILLKRSVIRESFR